MEHLDSLSPLSVTLKLHLLVQIWSLLPPKKPPNAKLEAAERRVPNVHVATPTFYGSLC